MAMSMRTMFARGTGALALAACCTAACLTTARAGTTAGPALPAGAQPADIDSLAARVRRAFDVPGMAVAIVKDGQTLFARGYGVRRVGGPDLVDADTLFGIGSNTKAFTVAGLAMLVDEGRLSWDDKVTDRLPGFQLYDPYVTRELTVRDLLTHRSGLGLGSGDLMLFPQSDFTRAEIIHNLRYLPPASSFRSKYAYDNLLYIAAGELIPAIAGVPWESFVQSRILDRIGGGCVATLSLAAGRRNVAAPHVAVDGVVRPVAPDTSTAYDPAGAIQCSARGMAAWANAQLADGRLPNATVLFSPARHAEMWTPQTIVPVAADPEGGARTRFRNYGLGWFLEDYRGALRVTHTGGLVGMVSYVSLLPEQHVGVVVLTNQQSGPAMAAVMQTLLDRFVGAGSKDWVAYWLAKSAEQAAQTAAAETAAAAAVRATGGRTSRPVGDYFGVYRDPWRGDATVRREGEKLRLVFSRTAGMQGDMTPMRGDVFVVHWDDRSLQADALVNFRSGFDGAISGMTMAPLSKTTDFSFDFQDLNFTRKPPGDPAART